MSEAWSPDWADYEHAYVSQYIAVNHPNEDEASGYDFIAYDWDYVLYVQADASTCEPVPGTADDVCGLVMIEYRDLAYHYVLGDYTEDEGDRYAHLVGNVYWFEDFPNLDLDIMGLGVPE